MIQNKLLYTVNSSLFPKVLKRLNDTKNTCIFSIADEEVYHLTREELKMEALVDDLDKKELTKLRYTKHILVYHHPYYLIIPIFEHFVFKNGKVNQHLNSLEIKLDRTKKNRKGEAPFFNVSFTTNRSTIQTFNTVVIKLKTITNESTNTN
jgi:hypothetical protein